MLQLDYAIRDWLRKWHEISRRNNLNQSICFKFFSCLIKKVVRDLQPIKMGNNLNQSICFKFFSVFDPKQFYKLTLKHAVIIYIIKEHIPTLYQPDNVQQGLCEKYCQQEIYDQL